ncbi:MAG: hypothetical protein PHE29_13565, partial [Tissierellia bacterium]|nr:hypothetical protein [Tissierellia bacterium]
TGVLINNMMGTKYKVVNITDENWSEIRPYYIKLMKDKKKIDILPEISITISKKNLRAKKRSKEMEDAITMFGEEIVEIN